MRSACLLVVLALASMVLAEDRQVRVKLDGGETIEGTLLDFGSRVYRFRIGGKVLEVSEARVVEIEFLTPKEAPAAVVPSAAPGRCSIATVEGDVRETMRALARRYGMNLVLGPAVRGVVTAWIPDAEPRVALDAIAMACNYKVEEANGVLTVLPAPWEAERFTPPEGKEAGPPATLEAKEMDVALALSALAKTAGRGIVISPSVRGVVTLSFSGVPALVALDSAAAAVNCGLFEAGGGILIVSPALPRERAEQRAPFEVPVEGAEAGSGPVKVPFVVPPQPKQTPMERLAELEGEEQTVRLRQQQGLATETDVIRAWFRVHQRRQWLGLESDEEFEKHRADALAKEQAHLSSSVENGLVSKEQAAVTRAEMENLYLALPRDESLLRPDEKLRMEVVGHPELSRDVTVRGSRDSLGPLGRLRGDGSMVTGLLGPGERGPWSVDAVGLTLADVQRLLEAKVRQSDPTLDVRVTRVAPQK